MAMKKTKKALAVTAVFLLVFGCCSGCDPYSKITVFDNVTSENLTFSIDPEIMKTDSGWTIIADSNNGYGINQISDNILELNDDFSLFDSDNYCYSVIATNNEICPFLYISRQFDEEESEGYENKVIITSETFDFEMPLYSSDEKAEHPGELLVDWLNNLDSSRHAIRQIYFPLHLTDHVYTYKNNVLKGNQQNPFSDFVYLKEGVSIVDFYNYYIKIERYDVERYETELGDDCIHVSDKASGLSFNIEYRSDPERVFYYLTELE